VFLILVVIAVSLTVLLWVGTFFFQGYIYTEPTPGLYWQAPVTALLLTFGYAIWCYSIAMASAASTTNIPIDTLFRFSPRQDMLSRPATRIWATRVSSRKGDIAAKQEVTLYESKRDGPREFHYQEPVLPYRRWNPQDVVSIKLEQEDGTEVIFYTVPVGTGEYRQFMSKDGWVMHEFETGPTGLPMRFSFGRLIWNLIFNFGHLLGWFVLLWIILRYQWGHALGLALVLWAIISLTVLPMMLTYAGSVAASRRTAMALLGIEAVG
jgi:hypothetical protein